LHGVSDFLSLVWDAELLQLMLLACPDGVVVADAAGEIILYTGSSEQIFGYSPIEVLHKNVSMLFGTPEAMDILLDRLKRDGAVVNLEMPGNHKETGHFIAAVSSSACRDRWGEEIGLVLYVRDHTNVRAIEDALRDNNERLNDLVSELNHLASHDALTGLLNRGSAMGAAEATLLTGGLATHDFGVVVMDLDHFKSVNDTYGHLVGDEVLTALGRVLRSVARSSDIVGRLGGEEFIAFLPGADLHNAAAFAERVRFAIERARVTAGAGLIISATISAGVAAIPGCADGLQEAIRVADDRLYMAKRGGRNRVVATELITERDAA
jgi:diguanylate cyclase (GGDEF)-like protein/PAS domain S-box-containing protein